jgi:NAD(P)-dependent dehydrogenase (short-subunit alcohol dehydrogenase family)
MPVWFITGCSSGFGRELARAVLARGWSAVVTARDPAAVADIVAGHADTALSLKLDVRDRGQIDAAVRAAEAIITAVQSDRPPFRLELGRNAFERIRLETEAQHHEMEAWAGTSLGTDFRDQT